MHRPVKIPRHIDSLPQILWFELDELLMCLCCLLLGILTRHLLELLVIGAMSVYVIVKLKSGRSEGVVFHWIWWHGVPLITLRRSPGSHVREFLE